MLHTTYAVVLLFVCIATGNQLTNSTLYTLCRNSDLYDIVDTIVNYETRFNSNFHYDWVFLNNEPFDENFKKIISNAVSGTAKFGEISPDHWSIPPTVDENLMFENIEYIENDPDGAYPYHNSISYRNMCRFESGFFALHPLLLDYDYFWRVEPGVKLYCDINYDIFSYMVENDFKYGFTISALEYPKTIPSLFNAFRSSVNDDSLIYNNDDNYSNFIVDKSLNDYNLCHFWTNFEIGNLNLFRSNQYLSLFQKLDSFNGFYYERWGDAPIRTLILSTILKKGEIKRFKDIGYEHSPYLQCPQNLDFRIENRCSCDIDLDITNNWFSCSWLWDHYFDN